jgi:putative Mg2+ transporter-C (MgtC) family protein
MTKFVIESTLLFEIFAFFKVFMAVVIGGIIGLEREVAGKEAGIRTFAFICAGACSFTILSEVFSADTSARIIANIVAGIGFLAGGLIFRTSGDNGAAISHGLTTAASIWLTTAIGIMIGLELYVLSLSITGLALLALHLPSYKLWTMLSKKKF